MRRRAVMLMALVALFAGASAARAGTYTVVACNAPGGRGVNSWWIAYAGGASGADFDSAPNGQCAGPSGAWLHPSAAAGAGQRAAWAFRAPPGDVITHVTVWRKGKVSAGWHLSGRAGTAITGGTVLEGCQTCTVGANGLSVKSRADFSVPHAPVVSWGLECASNPPCAGGQSNALLNLQGARVTVSDPTPPSLAAGGTLLAGGWRRSGEPVSADAIDASGVRSLTLLVDGAVRGTVSEPCYFRRPAPCPITAATTFSPGALADGTHTVTLLATDTAGNVSSAARAIAVDGSAPHAELLPVRGRRLAVAVSDAVSGVAGGQLFVRDRPSAPWRPLATGFAGGRLTATADRDPDGLGIRVVASDGAANTLDATVTSMRLSVRISGHRRFSKIHDARVAVPYGRSVTLHGQLTTTDDAPLAGQPIAVTARVHRLGAPRLPLSGTVTDANGRFSLHVPAGPSRFLEVTYPGGAGLLQRVRLAELRVAAWSSIHASRRVLFGRGRVRFSGRLGLRGVRVPPSGKLIDLQAFDAGRWRTFATARARGRHGEWHASNLFSGRPGRFPIRVRIRRESTFPYELGYSRAVTVRVL